MKKTVGTPEELQVHLKYLDKDKKYEIKEYKEIRGLNANSYAWVLISKIADKLGLSKEEVYLQMLKDYGQSLLIPVREGENIFGYFKYYEYETTSLLNGVKADWYKVYKGSSQYNTKEMSILINGIVQEANQLEIPTLTDKQLEQMTGEWHNESL